MLELAAGHGLRVLEDCAQAHGATLRGQRAGSFGELAAFSFYPTKVLGAYGDGGLIATKDEALAEACRRLRYYGMAERYYVVGHGHNTRLDEVQAEILRRKLKRIDAYIERRQTLAARYVERVREVVPAAVKRQVPAALDTLPSVALGTRGGGRVHQPGRDRAGRRRDVAGADIGGDVRAGRGVGIGDQLVDVGAVTLVGSGHAGHPGRRGDDGDDQILAGAAGEGDREMHDVVGPQLDRIADQQRHDGPPGSSRSSISGACRLSFECPRA